LSAGQTKKKLPSHLSFELKRLEEEKLTEWVTKYLVSFQALIKYKGNKFATIKYSD
jgi:hypothetical protein